MFVNKNPKRAQGHSRVSQNPRPCYLPFPITVTLSRGEISIIVTSLFLRIDTTTKATYIRKHLIWWPKVPEG